MNRKIHILLSEVYCVWQVVKTIISNNAVHRFSGQSLRTVCLNTRLKKMDHLLEISAAALIMLPDTRLTVSRQSCSAVLFQIQMS